MKIAIASGKGGTGKTTVATNLAALLGRRGESVAYLDCDVEEPNGHLFLNPTFTHSLTATLPIPHIDEALCTACGECVSFCAYKALVRLGKVVMVFPELCHGCGGCTLVCAQGAISEVPKPLGVVEQGMAQGTHFVHGRLTIGEAMSPPLIRAVLDAAPKQGITIIDAPPGTSCPAIAAIRDADYVLLVTEPTPFGLNDLGLALDMVVALGIPHGVLVNRSEAHNADAQDFCAHRHTPIVSQIPDVRAVAEAYSRGELIIDTVAGAAERFAQLWVALRKQVQL
jgi:MinD superfamily P-loop ATPase